MKCTVTKLILILIGGLLLVRCAAPGGNAPTTVSAAVDAAAETSSDTATDTAIDTATDTLAGGTLTFVTATGSQSFTLDELREALPTDTFTIDDPLYERAKTYAGFWLTDLLSYTNMLSEPGDAILFRAADGYESRLDVTTLDQTQPRGFVAFRDVEAADGWEPVSKGKSTITPAPFYLVWGFTDADAAATMGADALSPGNMPWPYQLIEIELIDFATTYDRLFPDDVTPDSEVYQGFQLFTDTCVKCHSINLQGGTAGPELNIPQNITEYRDPAMLAAFARNPSRFRAGSKMPAMEEKLSDAELDAVLTYIGWMADHKWQGDKTAPDAGATPDAGEAGVRDVLFQTSTLSALQRGVYDGQLSVGELKRHGDFGLGTFNALDGEMIVLDGQVYQVQADGVARIPADAVRTPFAAVVFFSPEQTATINDALACADLFTQLSTLLPSPDVPHAIQLDGTFASLQMRAPHRESQPYRPLAEALADQAVFEHQNISGTMVGFHLPDAMAGLNAAGYHFHFISADGQAGGHVLDCQTDSLTVAIDALDSVHADFLQE